MLTLSATDSQTFELPPAGAVAARCSRILDLGSQESTFEGERREQRKVLLSWELAELRTEGTPHHISRRFGLSLHEKAALRQFLVAWRGRQFTDDELKAFDLRKLAGAPCMLNVVHVDRAGKQYANIASISPLPRGMVAPELTSKPLVLDLDAEDAPAIIEQLSDSLQETITGSPEWRARISDMRTPAPTALDAMDDDIPF